MSIELRPDLPERRSVGSAKTSRPLACVSALALVLVTASCGGSISGSPRDAGVDVPPYPSPIDCTPIGDGAGCPPGCTAHSAVSQPSPTTCWDNRTSAWTGESAVVGCYPTDHWLSLPSSACYLNTADGTIYGANYTYAPLVFRPGFEECTYSYPRCPLDARP